MKAEITICDKCKKETRDIYAEIGWISIESGASYGSFQIRRYKGRDAKGNASTFFDYNVKLDFCSKKCFDEYVWDDK